MRAGDDVRPQDEARHGKLGVLRVKEAHVVRATAGVLPGEDVGLAGGRGQVRLGPGGAAVTGVHEEQARRHTLAVAVSQPFWASVKCRPVFWQLCGPPEVGSIRRVQVWPPSVVFMMV